MRLRRLDLIRYGHFTDYTLDFCAGGREADLHLIYGPNEAGKSTAFDAYLDLLYGIQSRSPYNFLHDYENMAIGGAVDLDDGRTVELHRIKKTKNDLLDADGQPINPAILQAALRGIDRDQYRSMFSLDDETIEAGGDDILASRGSLGELLFSAAAGLSDLGEVLETARAEVDTFHKPRARKTRLQEAKRRLEALKSEIRELDVQASAYRTLRKTRDDAIERHASAKASRDRLLGERTRLDALLESLPLLSKLNDLRADLAARPNLPQIDENWERDAQEFDSRRISAETEKRSAEAKLAGLRYRRAELAQDPDILSVEEELARLLDVPRSRAQTAEEDLPRRRSELSALEEAILGLVSDIGVEDAETLRLSEIDVEKLDALQQEWSTAKNAIDQARREQTRAEEHLVDLDGELETQDILSTDGVDLGSLLKTLDIETRLVEANGAAQAMEDAKARLDEAVRDLSPSELAPSDLEMARFASEDASRLAASWEDLHDALSSLETQLEEAEVLAAQAAARLAAARDDERLSVEREEQEARKERDVAWKRHLEALSRETAETFHDWLLRSDGLQDARLAAAEQIAQVRELERTFSETEARRQALAAQIEAKRENVETVRSAVTIRLSSWCLPPDYDPRDLPGWGERLRRAQAAWREHKVKQARLDEFQQALVQAERSLRDILGSETAADLSSLVNEARNREAAAAERAAALKGRQEAHQHAKDELRERQRDVETCQAHLATIEERWAGLSPRLPIEITGPSDLKPVLPSLRKLLSRRADRSQLQRRIAAMERDLQDFTQSTFDLARRLGEAPTGPALLLSDKLKTRLETAKTARDTRQTLGDAIDEEEERFANAEAALAEIMDRTDERSEAFSGTWEVRSTADLVEAISAAKTVQALRQSISELEQRIKTRLGAEAIDDAISELEARDLIALQASREAIEQDLKEAEARFSGAIGDLRAAEDALAKVGGDDRVARLEEEREVLLLSLAEEAQDVAALRAGLLAAEAAISKYREAHRSRMLADTAQAFRTLTDGAYGDLSTQVDGKMETLLALRTTDNRSVTAPDMSKGTRFQLYLALRLAGYRQFTAGGTTLPFVADDIMETFDNSRTRAAISLLREISKEGQALYFTHHEHVVELAREVCGDDVVLHELAR